MAFHDQIEAADLLTQTSNSNTSDKEVKKPPKPDSRNEVETALADRLLSPYQKPPTSPNHPPNSSPFVPPSFEESMARSLPAPTDFSPLTPYPPLSEGEISRYLQDTSGDGFEAFLKATMCSPFPSYPPLSKSEISRDLQPTSSGNGFEQFLTSTSFSTFPSYPPVGDVDVAPLSEEQRIRYEAALRSPLSFRPAVWSHHRIGDADYVRPERQGCKKDTLLPLGPAIPASLDHTCPPATQFPDENNFRSPFDSRMADYPGKRSLDADIETCVETMCRNSRAAPSEDVDFVRGLERLLEARLSLGS